MSKVQTDGDIHAYFEYPSAPGHNWYDVLGGLMGDARVGIEPECSVAMRGKLCGDIVVSDAIEKDAHGQGCGGA